jgi:DNA-binding GntR family transcriptional regulator
MREVTRILTAIEEGDVRAADELLPLVYQELRQLAARRMKQENPGQTRQATALVACSPKTGASQRHYVKYYY